MPLRCGVTVWADLQHKQWAKVARRGYHELGAERFLFGYLRHGDVVLDVGAHIGMITAVAAKVVGPAGRVYAFEVDETNFGELEQTIRRNHLNNVQAENIALSDKPGIVDFEKPAGAWGSFEVSKDNHGSSLLSNIFGSGATETYSRPATTIDEYLSSNSTTRVDLIKVDVDGPELAILRGAASSLDRFRPALIVEAGMFNLRQGVSFEELFEFLTGYGYRVFGAARTDDRIVPIQTPSDLPVDVLNDDLDLFCCLPGVHDERLRNLWFA